MFSLETSACSQDPVDNSSKQSEPRDRRGSSCSGPWAPGCRAGARVFSIPGISVLSLGVPHLLDSSAYDSTLGKNFIMAAFLLVLKLLCAYSSSAHLPLPNSESTQPIEKQRLNRMNSIFQPVDLCLLSPAVSVYTAARSVLVSRLTSTCLIEVKADAVKSNIA